MLYLFDAFQLPVDKHCTTHAVFVPSCRPFPKPWSTSWGPQKCIQSVVFSRCLRQSWRNLEPSWLKETNTTTKKNNFRDRKFDQLRSQVCNGSSGPALARSLSSNLATSKSTSEWRQLSARNYTWYHLVSVELFIIGCILNGTIIWWFAVRTIQLLHCTMLDVFQCELKPLTDWGIRIILPGGSGKWERIQMYQVMIYLHLSLSLYWIYIYILCIKS